MANKGQGKDRKIMTGIWYGVGVGPGDPELMTMKAIKKVRECDVVVIPVSDSCFLEPLYEKGNAANRRQKLLEASVAYQIVYAAFPEIEDKDKLYLPMPMIKEKERLAAIHDKGAAASASQLDAGKKLAFITLGDPTVYSTCLYIHKRIKAMGYDTVLIPGVPSFCAAAARMDDGLVENRDELHILPASYEIEQNLDLPGTKVLMKVGKQMPQVKELIKKKGMQIKMVENCGMADERIVQSVADIPDDAGYYSLIMIKEEKGRTR